MKTISSFLLFAFIFICLIPAVHAESCAFSDQTAYVIPNGSAILTIVTGGSISQFVIGYQGKGELGNRWSKINGHMKVRGSLGDQSFFIERTFNLDRLPDGKGYVSPGMDFDTYLWYDFTGGGRPQVETMEFSFSMNDRVDTNKGEKYVFQIVDVFNPTKSEMFQSTKSPSYPSIAPDIWDWMLKRL